MKRSLGLPRNDLNFSFAEHASTFSTHIGSSIPAYEHLIETCLGLSRRFIQDRTNVVDVGCSAGHLLSRLYEANREIRSFTDYIGLDSEPAFACCWDDLASEKVKFVVSDALSYSGFTNVSLACSLFTVQFLPWRDKPRLIQKVYDGLVAGGAMIIAEKVLASTARLQDALTFPYYDFKLVNGFTAQDILDKERSLRGQMTLWSSAELESALRLAGFVEIERIWEAFPFSAYLAIKEG